MSQAGILDIESSNPQIPTSFITDNGTAIPIFNELEVLGINGINTLGSGNTVTIDGSGLISTLTLTGNDSVPISPISDNFNIFGSGSIITSGLGNTLTVALTGLTNHSVLVGAGTSTITKVSATGNTGAVLQNNSGADPSYSTATYPSTTTINQILYSSSANTVEGVTAGNDGVLISSHTGVPSWLANSGTAGWVLTANTNLPPSWQSLPATGVTSITGTADQVLANGTSGAAQTGPITLTTPQDIATTSDVTFNRVFGPAGTSGAPTYSFTGFTDTGVFRNNNEVILTGGGFATGAFGFNVLISGGITTISQGFVLSGISSQTANFTTGYSIHLYLVDVTTGSAAITAELVNDPIPGQIYTIKDSTGAAATYNITVSGTVSGKTIDGLNTMVIDSNFGSVKLIYNSVQWNVI